MTARTASRAAGLACPPIRAKPPGGMNTTHYGAREGAALDRLRRALSALVRATGRVRPISPPWFPPAWPSAVVPPCLAQPWFPPAWALAGLAGLA